MTTNTAHREEHKAAYLWQEWTWWQTCAAFATNESDRQHLLKMAADARRDLIDAEMTNKQAQKGRME